MDRSSTVSRRDLMRLGAAAVVAAPLAGRLAGSTAAAATTLAAAEASDPWKGLKVGIASYTYSKLPLEKAVDGIRRLGVHYVSIKDSHLPLKSSAEQRKEVAQKFKDAGLTPLSCGVIGMKTNEADLRNAFEYARDAGIPTIVCSPVHEALPALEKLVKEFDIRLAIHNHGPSDKLWPSPFDVWEGVKSMDSRIGLCIDVGHTARCDVDPADAIRKCAPRLFDVHMKDLQKQDPRSPVIEVGRGVLDIRGILQALLDTKFAYHVGLEYEKDMNDPQAGAAESIGYIRGVLSDMKAS